MHAIEMTGTIDAQHQLVLDEVLPMAGPVRVRVIVLVDVLDEIAEAAWMKSAAANPAFAFLDDEREDIYSLSDGKVFRE